MTIEVEPRQGIPEGAACLLVDASDASDRGKVELFQNDMPIDRGIEVTLDPAKLETVKLAAMRGTDQAAARDGTAIVKLKPIVFYRGRTFGNDTAALALESVQSQFLIGIESDKETIARQRGQKIADLPQDQFSKRPFAVSGFAYPSCFHPSVLTILYQARDKKNVEVDVELRYDDGREPRVQKLTLESGKKQTFAQFKIAFDDARPRDPKVSPAGKKFLRQLKLVVSVWPGGRIGKGRPLVQQAIELSEVNPEKYNTIGIFPNRRKRSNGARPLFECPGLSPRRRPGCPARGRGRRITGRP